MGKTASVMKRLVPKYSDKDLRTTLKIAKSFRDDCLQKSAAYTRHAQDWTATVAVLVEESNRRRAKGKRK